jgi:hypothetical protein
MDRKRGVRAHQIAGPGKKDQQVQIGAVAEYAHLGDNAANLFSIHISLRSRAVDWSPAE